MNFWEWLTTTNSFFPLCQLSITPPTCVKEEAFVVYCKQRDPAVIDAIGFALQQWASAKRFTLITDVSFFIPFSIFHSIFRSIFHSPPILISWFYSFLWLVFYEFCFWKNYWLVIFQRSVFNIHCMFANFVFFFQPNDCALPLDASNSGHVDPGTIVPDTDVSAIKEKLWELYPQKEPVDTSIKTDGDVLKALDDFEATKAKAKAKSPGATLSPKKLEKNTALSSSPATSKG